VSVHTAPDDHSCDEQDRHSAEGDRDDRRVAEKDRTDQSLEHLDATFIQHCEGAVPARTGEIKYDSAPVLTPPAEVSNLTATRSSRGVRLTWKNPALSRYRYTVVRVEPANPGASGRPRASPLTPALVRARR
jgi:hypothetical protein